MDTHVTDVTGTSWPTLNDAQQAAVAAPTVPQLVVAGPGTGKTRVLTCRAAHLIENEEVAPSEIVLVTFTRRAAGELTDRLTGIVGPEARGVRAGTIHHFCYEVLRAHADQAGLPEDFVVADEAVTDPFWQRWYDAHEEWARSQDLGSYRQLKTHVSRIKLGIDAVQGPLQDGIRAYQKELRRRGALDFDDLQTRCRDLLEENEAVREEVAASIQAMLVDEFQDTDPVQYRIIKRLGDEGVTLFCVADGDQSVYRFRGARPKNIRRFAEDFGCFPASSRCHVLRENYRTSRVLYEVAEGVLGESGGLKTRGEIRPQAEGDRPVLIAPKGNREKERAYVRRQVQQWIDEGTPRSEIAVLTRWNSRLSALEQDFLEAGIACRSSNTEDLMDTPPARKLKALFRVVDARRRGRALGPPMGQLLREMLPDEIVARLEDFGRRALSGETLWTIFQTVVSDRRARQSAGLEGASRTLRRTYATVTNLLQKTQSPGLTIGAFGEAALGELADPLRLLEEWEEDLTDPGGISSLKKAGALLDKWKEKEVDSASGGAEDENNGGSVDSSDRRLLVHHPTPQITRLWRQLLRRALGIETDPPAPLPEMQEALFARPTEEGIPPLGPEDLVITADLEGLFEWGERTGAMTAEGSPRIIVLSEEIGARGSGTLPMGIDPDRVTAVAEAPSPSVRLFKALQVATGPGAPRSLFPEYVMVDLEATSADPNECRVAEIGALRVEHGEVTGSFSELVELPGDLSKEEVRTLKEVCGLDPERDFQSARPENKVWADFCEFVGEAPLVAHNGQQYDFRVLRRLAEKHETEARWSTTYDLLPAAHNLLPDRERYDAESLREDLLGETKATEHRALADCRDQQRILEALQERRARRRRILNHEELLPLVVAALTYEPIGPGELSTDGQALLQVGHTWALRDASPASEELGTALPRALPDRVRQSPMYEVIDEDALMDLSQGLQPGLVGRLQSLLEPYADEALLSPALEGLLNHLTLWGGPEKEDSSDRDVVSLSTYHSAKGLEFEKVICMDVHDSAFPPYFARDPEERAESRRLLYVGMTRAARELVLTYPQVEQGHKRTASPFLKGVNRNLVERAPSLSGSDEGEAGR